MKFNANFKACYRAVVVPNWHGFVENYPNCVELLVYVYVLCIFYVYSARKNMLWKLIIHVFYRMIYRRPQRIMRNSWAWWVTIFAQWMINLLSRRIRSVHLMTNCMQRYWWKDPLHVLISHRHFAPFHEIGYLKWYIVYTLTSSFFRGLILLNCV